MSNSKWIDQAREEKAADIEQILVEMGHTSLPDWPARREALRRLAKKRGYGTINASTATWDQVEVFLKDRFPVC